MNNLAAAYWRQKRLDRSIPLFEETVKLSERKRGRTHPDTILNLANLGVNYKDADRLAEAIPLLEEARRGSKKYDVRDRVGLALVEAYSSAGEDVKLADLLREQLAEARQALPKDSPQLASKLAQIGSALLHQKKWAEAEPVLRECLAIREKTQRDVWTTFNTLSVLGGALLGQKKYADAEPLLLKGYEGMKAREKTIPKQGGAELRIPEALDRLIDLYTATDKPDGVTKWKTERAKYPEVAAPPREKK
jgi:tetratricopeptide (TPR) repeat protein